jgi:hypothetical protein
MERERERERERDENTGFIMCFEEEKRNENFTLYLDI